MLGTLSRSLAFAVVALGLVTYAPTPAQAEVSPTVTVCVDGPNHFDQMYRVDCATRSPIESDDVCWHSANSTVNCSAPTGVDSNTRCMYQYDHLTNPTGEFAYTDAYFYEQGRCEARGDTVDPSPYCASFLQYKNGGTNWFLDHQCPSEPQVPGTWTSPYPPGEEREPVHFTITGAKVLNPGTTNLVATAQDMHSLPWGDIEVRICRRDQVTGSTSCTDATTDSRGRAAFEVTNPRRGQSITIIHTGGVRTVPAGYTKNFRVQGVVQAKVKGSKVIATVKPGMKSKVTLQKKARGRWVKVRSAQVTSRYAFTKLSTGKYRVHLAKAATQGRLGDYSESVAIRTHSRR